MNECSNFYLGKAISQSSSDYLWGVYLLDEPNTWYFDRAPQTESCSRKKLFWKTNFTGKSLAWSRFLVQMQYIWTPSHLCYYDFCKVKNWIKKVHTSHLINTGINIISQEFDHVVLFIKESTEQIILY